MCHMWSLFFLLIFLTQSNSCKSWSWFSSSSNSQNSETLSISTGFAAEFSVDGLRDEKGIERVVNAKIKLEGPKSCWYDAYQGLFTACSEITSDDNEKRKRFAWSLSNCFQKDSGRPPFPSCSKSTPMKTCLQKLDNNAIHTYRQFFLETNSICHQLQSDIFRRQTERLVNDLKKSANYAEEKLEKIEEKSDHLLQDTKDIHDSLNSITQQAKQIVQTSKNVSDHIGDIVKQSEAVFDNSEKISASQSELQKGQEKMKENFELGMTMIKDSYHNLGEEIVSLQDETVQIEKKLATVADSMSTKMNNLHTKADDIGNVAGISLEKQKELLNGQSEALNGLQSLAKFQSQALEESRVVLQQLAKFGHEQQEELVQRQKQLTQAHDHLVENSKSILTAQEAFEQKQANMFVALDKLFALHNALLLESRLIKAFFIYSISIFIIYMFTSTKQTYTVRHKLYIGLCVTFLIESTILRFSTNSIEQQCRLINLVRSIFAALAMLQTLHAIFTYRDYEMLNYGMLKNLTEEVTAMRKHAELCWESDSETDLSRWADTEISDGIDNLKDQDFMIDENEEQVGDNISNFKPSITRYNLRSRRIQ